MSIILIHGNGLTGISKKLSEIKKDFDPLSIQEFSGKQIEFDQAVIGFSTGGLFVAQQLIILEDFDPSPKGSGQVMDLEILPNNYETTIVLKFTKSLSVSSVLLKQAATLKAQVFNFTEEGETNVFPFLDALAEKNPKFMGEFDSLLTEWSGQYLLTMIFYMLRRMVQDPKKLPPFVQQRIAKQKQNFPIEKITELYKAAIETDFKIKSGLMEEKIAMTLLINQILTN